MPVVDASVAVKWFVEEPDSPFAVTLRDAHIAEENPLAAPDFLVYEVANVLLHHRDFSSHDMERALATLYDLQLDLIIPTPTLVHTVARLAHHYRLTFYDALYVGLARELGTELVTADRHLHHRTSPLPFVRLLHS